MSMYVRLLTEAIEVWETDLDDDALLAYVRECQTALPGQGHGALPEYADALAAEITYDRALVCLAARHGIDVAPTNFAHPQIERERLELCLIRVGVDLVASRS